MLWRVNHLPRRRANVASLALAAGLAVAVLIPTPSEAQTFHYYVRGDGAGSDTNAGTSWATAFATLQKALTAVPYTTQTVIRVQATGPGEAGDYDVARRSEPYHSDYGTLYAFDIVLEGGYTNVAAAPGLGGVSVIRDRDGTVDETGFEINHQCGGPTTLRMSGFSIRDVARGIRLTQLAGADNCGIVLILTDTDIAAANDGVRIEYPHGYPSTGAGDPARIVATNVQIAAGSSGGQTNHGISISGAWLGSRITAAGTNPATGEPCVSSITSAGGCGVSFSSMNNETMSATFEHTVIYDCATNGIHLDAAQSGSGGVAPYRIQATLRHCTIAGNGGAGLHILSQTAPSWAAITNSIFANNAGQGVNLESTNGAFSCSEASNDFYTDALVVNGAPQTLNGTTVTADPLFWTQAAGPERYRLRWTASPCHRTASDGRNRGAWQNDPPSKGTLVFFK